MLVGQGSNSSPAEVAGFLESGLMMSRPVVPRGPCPGGRAPPT